MISAIVLAGAPADKFEIKLSSRAMIPVAGETMLDRIIFALMYNVGEIIVVGNVTTDLDVKIIEPKDTLMENIKVGLEHCKGDTVLIATSDIPLVKRHMVEGFIKEAKALKCGFVYPICDKETCKEKYPELKRTYVKIKEGEFTGGNLMYMTKDFLNKVLPIMQDLYLARKTPLKLAKIIGFDVIWRLIMCKFNPNALDIPFLEEKITKIFGEQVHALIVKHPEICEDLDSPEDFNKFELILRR